MVSQVVNDQYTTIDHIKNNFGQINGQIQSLVRIEEENNKNVIHIAHNLEEQSININRITEVLDQLNMFAAKINS